MQKNTYAKKSLLLHRKLKGKIEITGKTLLDSQEQLSLLYTPGVGAVSDYVGKHPEQIRKFTVKGNMVAVISDGSAVLGLGNIGPEGAIPVLEGKCIIFKRFASVNAFPIALNTQNTEEIISAVKAISPIFGGINLEDISAPRCFEIEERLHKELTIPVMHDDQHGTAIVVLAALTNALRVVRKNISRVHVVINGAGPAGVAVSRLLVAAGVKNIIILDSGGIIGTHRSGLVPYKKNLLKWTNKNNIQGGLRDALRGADVFIGVSRGSIMNADDMLAMKPKAIIFSLANPIPEIMPEEARRGGAAVIATGRSDFPNQINNALVFPGVFRGALDHNVKAITQEMKLHAARSLARLVAHPRADSIIPSIFDKRVVPAIARAIRSAKMKTSV